MPETFGGSEQPMVATVQGFFEATGAQTLADYRAIFKKHKSDLLPEIQEAILSKIKTAEAKVNSLATVFQPEEQSLFQNIRQNAKINLSANSNAEIYADIFHQIDIAGIADTNRKEKLKEQVAEKLGIKINKYEIDNGDDVLEAMQKGYATDEEGKNIPFTESNPLEQDGLQYWNENPKNPQSGIKVRFYVNGTPLTFTGISGAESGNEVTQKINAVKVIFSSGKQGLRSALSHNKWAEQGTSEIDLNSGGLTSLATEMKFIANGFLGGDAGYNGEIISESKLQDFEESLRIFYPQGDTGAHTMNDPDRVQEIFRATKFYGVDGKVNPEMTQVIGNIAQELKAKGAELSLESLKNELIQRLPDQFSEHDFDEVLR